MFPAPHPSRYDPGMFTGIVQAQGTLVRTEPQPSGLRLVVERAAWTPRAGSEPGLGDSVCVSGVCLTVVDSTATELSFDVIAETLDKTKLGSLRVGDRVNLEPSVTPSQPLGGHFMQGHVDGVGEVVRIDGDPADRRVAIRVPADFCDAIVPKGSVAIDGVSLTLAAVTGDVFEVALIPMTLEVTTLGALCAGDPVNLEADIIVKAVAMQLQRMLGGNPVRQNPPGNMGREAGGPRKGATVTVELLRAAGLVPD